MAFESGSFSAAARVLAVTPQAVSRSVARLEGTLGVTLFRRTTRSLVPTSAAAKYYQRCTQALALLNAGETELAHTHATAVGTVRVSVPTAYGHHVFLPLLAGFGLRYPRVHVEVEMSSRNADFVTQRCDIAIRMGKAESGALISRSLGEFPLGVYASPLYLARCGVPANLAALEAHSCIVFTMPRSGRALPWLFGQARENYNPAGAYRCSGDLVGALSMARAGLGLAQLFDFMADDDVQSGQLIQVLAAHRGATRRFSLVYPGATPRAPATRAFVEFLLEYAKRDGR